MKKLLLFTLLALGAGKVVAGVQCLSMYSALNPYTGTCTVNPPSQSCPPGQQWNKSEYWVNNVNHSWFCNPIGIVQ